MPALRYDPPALRAYLRRHRRDSFTRTSRLGGLSRDVRRANEPELGRGRSDDDGFGGAVQHLADGHPVAGVPEGVLERREDGD